MEPPDPGGGGRKSLTLLVGSPGGGASLGVRVEERRARSPLRRLAIATAVAAALVGLCLILLELRLSGPTGMSVYVLQRTLRNWVRDATVPEPPWLDGFANAGPNVLVVILDCYRFDYLRHAPALRALGERSWRYDSYYAAAPWTKPSTVSLFTGLVVRRHYVIEGGASRLPAEVVTIAERMRERGLRTAGFVWNPHLTRRQAFDQGFEHYVDDARRGSTSLLYELFAWLDRERPERFFAYVHFQGTHDPYYDDNDLSGLLGAPKYPGDLDLTNMEYKQAVRAGRGLSPEESAHLAHIAYAKAARIDRQAVRGLVDRLERSKLLDNTLLVISSDHGDGFFEHGNVSHGSTIHAEETHVPLVIHYPRAFGVARGFPATGVDRCPASTVDLLPTALDFVGAPPLPDIDGVSLVPSARNRSCGRAVISERTLEEGRIGNAALMSGGLKLIVDYRNGERGLRLYDLAADPGETNDLADARAADAQRLDAELARRLNADGSSMARWSTGADEHELSDEQREALRELGYVE